MAWNEGIAGASENIWVVVGGLKENGIKVRKERQTSSPQFDVRLSHGSHLKEFELAGNRLHYQKVSGTGPDVGWVSIKFEGRDLVRRLDHEELLTQEDQSFLAPDVVTPDDVLAELEKELAKINGEGSMEDNAIGQLLAGGVPEEHAEGVTPDVKRWVARAREWLGLFNSKVSVPAHIRLPPSAISWEPAAGVLAIMTHLHFDPRRDVREPQNVPIGGERPLVSVVCVTSDRHLSYHPLLYENFKAQTYEPRELIVVHTGEMPSDYLSQRAEEDPRVVYRFFLVTTEAPGSPRLSDEKQTSPWAAVLVPDEPAELTHWHWQSSPWNYEIERDGWSKGLKRNVACCIARGSIVAHFEDGCLYASAYLSTVVSKFNAQPSTPAALALSNWYTVSIADQDFRSVDLRKPEPLWEQYGQNPYTAQTADQFNHGFVYVYTRSAWERHPFPELETVGMQDSAFVTGLKRLGVSVFAVNSGMEGLTACGWHRDSTCGAKDAPANINHSQVLNFLMQRGEEARSTPLVFREFIPLVKEIAQGLLTRREAYLKELINEHGSVYVCAHCNFAIALSTNLKDSAKQVTVSRQAIDAYDMTMTLAKVNQTFEVGEFIAAGGAVAEGHWETPFGGHSWLHGRSQRMAICRNCGWQVGWRYEAAGGARECASPGCTMLVHSNPSKNRRKEYCCDKCADRGAWNHNEICEQKTMPLPQGPITWGFILRHLRERHKPGELVPKGDDVKDGKRHHETSHNKGKSNVCPSGHPLRRFCTGQGNGGVQPLFYICDICDQPARGSQHMWGCGTCDYDLCERCKGRRA